MQLIVGVGDVDAECDVDEVDVDCAGDVLDLVRDVGDVADVCDVDTVDVNEVGVDDVGDGKDIGSAM